MRRFWLSALLVASMIGSVTCATKNAPMNGGDRPRGSKSVQVKIVVKRNPDDSTKCVSRTIPKLIQVDYGDDDSLVFNIRQHPGANCLPNGVDLELRFAGQNPTACSKPGTAASGNKTRFQCDLETYVPGGKYTFKVFRVGGVPGGQEEMEDPDIEIVQF